MNNKNFSPEPTQKIRGSLPDLRHDCCTCRYAGSRIALYRMHESSGSTESLLEEADEFVRHCNDEPTEATTKKSSRRCSEADIQRGELTMDLIGLIDLLIGFVAVSRLSSFETIVAVLAEVAEMLETRSVGKGHC